MTPLILTVDGDRRQSTQVAALVNGAIDAEMVQASTAAEGLQALGGRVPDLILTSPLLSPKDDGLIAGHLRQLGRAAAHVQTLTIPMLRKGAPKPKAQRGVLAALRRGKTPSPATDGCDPQVFAEQVRLYLATAAEYRDASARQTAEPVVPEPAASHATFDAPETHASPSTWPADADTPAIETGEAAPAWAELSAPQDAPIEAADTVASISADAPALVDDTQSTDTAVPSWTPEAEAHTALDVSPDAGDQLAAVELTGAVEPHAGEPMPAMSASEPAGSILGLDEPGSYERNTEPPSSGARDVSVAALEALFDLDGPADVDGAGTAADAVGSDSVTGNLAVDDSQAPEADATPEPAVLESAEPEPEPVLADLSPLEPAPLESAPVEPAVPESSWNEPVVLEPAALAPAEAADAECELGELAETGAGLVETVPVALVPETSQNAEETANARAVAAFVEEPPAFAEFYVQTPAVDAWAALTTQPLSALTRPEEHSENRVPLVDMGACEDLDLLASGLAAGGDAATELFAPPVPAPSHEPSDWVDIDPAGTTLQVSAEAEVAAEDAPVTGAPITEALVDEPTIDSPVLLADLAATDRAAGLEAAPAADVADAGAATPWASDDAAVEAVKPLLYEVFADEFDEPVAATEPWNDDSTQVLPAVPAGDTDSRVLVPELVVESDAVSALAGEHDDDLASTEEVVEHVLTDAPAWTAAADEAAAPSAYAALEAADAGLIVAHDAPSAALEEFLHDEPVSPSHAAPAADEPWALPVLDAEALAMIGDAAVRALDTAVLRDFEMALAACDENGTPWHDSPETDSAAGTAGAEVSALTPGAAAVVAPNEPALPRVAVEFEAKPPADDWTPLGAGPAALAALVDKRHPKNDRPRDPASDRAKARLAAH